MGAQLPTPGSDEWDRRMEALRKRTEAGMSHKLNVDPGVTPTADNLAYIEKSMFFGSDEGMALLRFCGGL